MKKMRTKLSWAVGELLNGNGWSQSDAARRYSVNQVTVYRWVKGIVAPRPVALTQMVLDSSGRDELRMIFELALGKRVQQIMMEQAQYSPAPASSELPEGNVDELYSSVKNRSQYFYKMALGGDKEALKRLHKMLNSSSSR